MSALVYIMSSELPNLKDEYVKVGNNIFSFQIFVVFFLASVSVLSTEKPEAGRAFCAQSEVLEYFAKRAMASRFPFNAASSLFCN